METELIKIFAQIAHEGLKKMPNYSEKQWKRLGRMIEDLEKELKKPFFHQDLNKRQDPRVIVNLKGKIHVFAKNIISNLDS